MIERRQRREEGGGRKIYEHNEISGIDSGVTSVNGVEFKKLLYKIFVEIKMILILRKILKRTSSLYSCQVKILYETVALSIMFVDKQ